MVWGMGYVYIGTYVCGCPKQTEEGIGTLVPELQAVVDCLVEVPGTEVRSAARTVSGLTTESFIIQSCVNVLR